MPSREWKLPNRPVTFYEEVSDPAAAANSLFWYCAWCSVRYAEMRVVSATWHGIAGCCPDCSGNKFSLPGSMESVYLTRFELPQTFLEYQLSVELSFLQSKDHPHNAS